jgi:hypothetical protein
MVKRAKKQEDITIRWRGLDRTDVDDLHDFLKSQEGVTHVYTRVSTMDAAYDPSIHPKLTMIVEFSVGIGSVLGKGLEVAVKEWFKNRRTENVAPEIGDIYGADERIVRRVKKPRPPKAK